MAGVQYYEVQEDESGQRLDNYLTSRLKGAPKSLLYRIIRKGEVRVNKGRVKPDYRLVVGDLVRVPPMRLSSERQVAKPSYQLIDSLREAVLYDDGGLIVVDKPSGIAVHGGSGVSIGLIEAMRQIEGSNRFLELVHRLDRDTSGCIMIARKRSVLKFLQEGLRKKNVIQKTYRLLVHGSWPEEICRVNAPLYRYQLPNGERVVRVDSCGKDSVTEFKVLRRFRNATLMEAKPLTGRTHQIRVHALHVGCALVGDSKYAGSDKNAGDSNKSFREAGIKRLFLHAYSLEFERYDGGRLFVEAPMPKELIQPLKHLSR